MKTFREMGFGKNITQVGVIKIEEKKARNGKVYSNITLSDGTETIEAKMWADPNRLAFNTGNVLEVEIDKSDYQGASSYIVNSASVLDIPIEDYLPHAPIIESDCFNELMDTIHSIFDDDIRTVSESIMNDYAEEFKRWTAAMHVHHNYFKGLLYHTVRMLRSAKKLAEVYNVNTDVLYASTILHDIAKIKEYSMDAVGGTTVSVDGTLYGHIVMGIEMIDKYSIESGINPFETESIKMIKHCIMAHHGKLEYGSPVLPATKEAMLLHEIDTIDAQMWQYETEESKIEEGTTSDKCFGLGTRVYKSKF